MKEIVDAVPWWAWLAGSWAILLSLFAWPYWLKHLDRRADAFWQDRENMEQALWAECQAEAARGTPIVDPAHVLPLDRQLEPVSNPAPVAALLRP